MKLDEFEKAIGTQEAIGTPEAAAELRRISAEIRQIAWNYNALARACNLANQADESARLKNCQGRLPRFQAIVSGGVITESVK